MSTVKEIEAAIPNLSPPELEELRAWLEKFFQDRGSVSGQAGKRRSVLRLRALPGQWIGEPILKSGDLADEMFERA
jgi:hypothetical protein